MHLSEFKAWFEGFTEDMDGPPDSKQWKKIRERVKGITADYTPAPIFIDRYVSPYRPYWRDQTICLTDRTGVAAARYSSSTTVSLADFTAAGRAEAMSMRAAA